MKTKSNWSDYFREIIAGTVTFSTMAYIICVQPAIMSGSMFGFSTGMEIGPLMTTTCIASAFGCLLMGLWARYPFALAPGMGENFFVIITVLPFCTTLLGKEDPNAAWALMIGTVFLSGFLFLIFSLLGVRNLLFRIVPSSLRAAMGTGIGLFIAWLGLKNAGLLEIVDGQLKMGSLTSSSSLVFISGFLTVFFLASRKIPAAILGGIACSTIVAFLLGKLSFSGTFALPPDPSPLIGNIDIYGAIAHLSVLWPMILILLFLDIFDTFGTVMGVVEQANMIEENKLPRVDRIFLSDATATLFGAYCGHSTVTTFMESASGIAAGGRTGLTAITVGVWFLIALFLSPFLTVIAGYPPITSSALVFVGILMTKGLSSIRWSDLSEAIPCFFIIVIIPFTNSIADGILIGLILWPLLKLLSGRYREAHPVMYVLAVMLLLYAIFVLK